MALAGPPWPHTLRSQSLVVIRHWWFTGWLVGIFDDRSCLRLSSKLSCMYFVSIGPEGSYIEAVIDLPADLPFAVRDPCRCDKRLHRFHTVFDGHQTLVDIFQDFMQRCFPDRLAQLPPNSKDLDQAIECVESNGIIRQ